MAGIDRRNLLPLLFPSPDNFLFVSGLAGAARDLAANDVREDYLRARLEERADGALIATPVNHQDSSLLGNLAAARALVIRSPFAPAASAGSPCVILRLPV